VADDLVRVAGDAAIIAVLDWANSPGRVPAQLSRGDRWTQLLADHPDIVLTWLSNRVNLAAHALCLIAKVLDPHSVAVKTLGARFWLRLLDGSTRNWDLVSYQSFCMAIALTNSGSGSDELAARSFDALHAAAGNDALQYEDWQLFQRELPTLSWWQAWDRCERLRRGIVLAFVRYDWPADTLLKCTSDEQVFAAIVRSAGEVKHGKRLFRQLADEVRQDPSIAPEPQRSLLLNLR
jgi:hypothetical protein